MSEILNFIQSSNVLALLIAVCIFLTTIILAVKRWIGFPTTLLLLLFSLITGLIINHQQDVKGYFHTSSPASSIAPQEELNDGFQKQMAQAVEDLKEEVNTEKEKLLRVMNQVQEIFDSVEAQKQKLQHFIEETRERFKSEYPVKPPPSTIPIPQASILDQTITN